MPRPNPSARQRERARRHLVDKGWTAIFIGIVMLVVVPAFLRGPIAAALVPAIRTVGGAALLLGAVLLALHYATRQRANVPALGEGDKPVRTPDRASSGSSAAASMRREPVFESPSAAEPTRQPSQQDRWTPAVLAAVEWRRFESLCEAFYAQAGLATRSQSHGADGGVDIWLQSQHMDAPRIVQCKHWHNRPVGVKEMREFRGVMASHQLVNGTYVTSSTFTADAAAFAEANGIQTQDGAALLKLIGQRTPEQQAALLAVAYEGEYWKPTCASCGIKTTRKERKRDGSAFWGCSNYPRCKTTFAMRAA